MSLEVAERCENCGEPIGRLEKPYVWQDHIVCHDCRGKLTTSIQVPLGAQPTRGASRAPIIGAILLSAAAVCGTVVASRFIPSPVVSTVSHESTYEGRGFSEWMKLADDNDFRTSKGALAALRNFRGAGERRAIVALLRRRSGFYENITLYRAADEPGIREESVKTIQNILQSNFTAGIGISEEQVQEISLLFPEPRSLTPILEKMLEADKKEYPSLYRDGRDPKMLIQCIKDLKK